MSSLWIWYYQISLARAFYLSFLHHLDLNHIQLQNLLLTEMVFIFRTSNWFLCNQVKSYCVYGEPVIFQLLCWVQSILYFIALCSKFEVELEINFKVNLKASWHLTLLVNFPQTSCSPGFPMDFILSLRVLVEFLVGILLKILELPRTVSESRAWYSLSKIP